MSARRSAEAILPAAVFALTVVLPVGLILMTVATLAAPAGAVYGDSALSVVPGLVQDVRGLGPSGAACVAVFLLGAGFAVRAAVRGHGALAPRIAGGGAVLSVLAALVLDPVLDLRTARLAFALAAAGFAVSLSLTAWTAWRSTRTPSP